MEYICNIHIVIAYHRYSHKTTIERVLIYKLLLLYWRIERFSEDQGTGEISRTLCCNAYAIHSCVARAFPRKPLITRNL